MPSAAVLTNKLLESSRSVLLDCCLSNGAIIAANTDSPHYPKDSNNYRYVWPRDAAFVLYSLDLLDLNRTESFSQWLVERAENFEEQGLAYRRYATNGACSYPSNEFQPDQSGAMLWALAATNPNDSPVTYQAMKTIADTLCKAWNGQNFEGLIYDVWEHHYGHAENGNFTYTLASCAAGLKQAHQTHPQPQDEWLKTAESLEQCLRDDSGAVFGRLVNDNKLDSDGSLFGLVWPFVLSINEDKIGATISQVTDNLETETGIMRFKGDVYDGRVLDSIDLNQGAGPWPLLSFWQIIALAKQNRREEARDRYQDVISQLPADRLIPEQLLPDGLRGICPLAWSHAMFVIAAHELGYLDNEEG